MFIGHYEGRGPKIKIGSGKLCKMRNQNSLSPNVRQKCYLGKITGKPQLKPKPSPPGRLGLGLEESEAKARGFQPSQAVTSLSGIKI
jgi:hypothetical protein